ncbi:MAG TPA: thiol peroxidase [Candidatus Omnitrophota bacterium]|nr:thiol peroxidase [Candidatus Omnitrophota bacterium]
MSTERKGVITFQSNPLTLVGPEIRPGDPAPDFKVTAGDLSPAGLKDFQGKTILISVVPSLDTPVCDMQTRKFNQEIGNLAGEFSALTISMDLPFAQKRFCSTAGIEKIKTLSDYQDASFGIAYGVLIKELRLLTRAVFIVGRDGKIRYAEYVKEITQHPDYEKALQALKAALA